MVSKLEYLPCEYDTLCMFVCLRHWPLHVSLCPEGEEYSNRLLLKSWSRAEQGGQSGILILGFNSIIMPADIMTI